MSVLILPGFASLSEFVAGLNGDCGPLATLGAFHEYDPKRWPLTAAALHALDADEIAHGFAEQNGAQNIDHLSGYLDYVKVPHKLVSYAAFNIDTFHADLKADSGRKPIIVEWALAGQLPGDEPGVHFHFSTCGGINTGAKGDGIGGGYLWCDGDNRADDQSGRQTSPVFYTWQNIQAAQPIAYVIVDLPAPAPTPPPTVDWEVKYNDLKTAVSSAVSSH